MKSPPFFHTAWKGGVLVKRKTYGIFFLLLLLLGGACVSLGRAATQEEYVAAAGNQGLYRLDVAQGRGTIYDRNLSPLVGGKTQYVAAVAPTIEAIGALETVTQGQYREQLALALENGKPFQVTLETPVEDPRVDVFQVPRRYEEEQLAPHIVGYLDSLGRGASGVELAMDDVLAQYGGEISVTYQVDAVGRAIAGMRRQVTNTLQDTEGGVALTLDSSIQQLVQEAAQSLEKGAVVVTKVPTCEILALASVPDFSPLELEEATVGEDSPLINRGFSAYAPGSVWKLVTAAALLEEGMGELTTTCTGTLSVEGLDFHCINSTAHGEVDLQRALEQSCNCYFIHAAQLLGGEKILSLAARLGFGEAQEFGRGLWTASGTLPTRATLSNARALANFSFGQGELTVTPLQLCAMMNTLVSGGTYTSPSLIAGLVDEGKEQTPLTPSNQRKEQVLSVETASTLGQILLSAAQVGTGRPGEPEGVSVGIKTGTAQTGVQEGEEELLHFWYCGFVSGAGGPRYCITVLAESTPDDRGAAARVFRQVAAALGA